MCNQDKSCLGPACVCAYKIQGYLYADTVQFKRKMVTKPYTYSNANFAQNLFWDPFCFFQHLIKRSTILHNRRQHDIMTLTAKSTSESIY